MDFLSKKFEIDNAPALCPFSDVEFKTKRGEIFEYAKTHQYQTIKVSNVCDLLDMTLDEFLALQRDYGYFPTERQCAARRTVWINLDKMEPASSNDEITFESFIRSYEAMIAQKKLMQRQAEEQRQTIRRRRRNEFLTAKGMERGNFQNFEHAFNYFLELHAIRWGYRFSGCTFTRPNGDVLKIKAVNPGRDQITYAIGDKCVFDGEVIAE